MAAETVVIDVIANFKDQMSPGIDTAKSKADKFEKAVEKTKKQVDSLAKDKTSVKLSAEDKATPVVDKAESKLKSFARGVYKATFGAKDETASPLKNIYNGIKGFAGKTFKGTLSIIDKATAPIKGVMNTLFSLKTLAAGILGGMAANQLIAQPIALADQTETAFIGFETMFKSATKAQNMMNEIQQFAAKTPFDTSGVVSSVQQMIRAGWSVDQVMGDMEKIGNAAAAAGQGTEGVQGIVLALQQMKMAGKLNAQDMMQLTNRGVKAWQYVADAMGVTVQEARSMSEDGLIPVEKAIHGIIDGMGEYDGMMQKMSNRTVSGIMSNLKDTFDIKIVSKWGKGLAEGATMGFGKLADWLDMLDPMLQSAGTSLQELGADLSSGFFDVVEKGYTKLEKVLSSPEFQNADGIMPKIKIVWDEMIAEPFGEWWDTKGYPWIVDKMSSAGKSMGSGLSSIFKGLLGFNSGEVVDEATTIGGGFAKGFLEGFDGSGVWDALKRSIKDAFTDALNIFKGSGDGSSWLSAALIGYGGLKLGSTLVGGYNTIAGVLGKQTLGKALIGSGTMTNIGTGALTGQTMTGFTGTGLIGLLGNTGYALGSGAATAGGLALAGGAGIAGGIAGGVTLYSGIKDMIRAGKADTSTELGLKENEAYGKSSLKKIGGVAGGAMAGAAIGSVIPVIGTAIGGLIGAGVGGVAGWISGNKDIKEYEQSVAEAEEETRKLKIAQEQAKYSSKSMKEAVKDLSDGTITATEFQEKFNQAVKEDKKSHFGDIKLSLQEIADTAKNIVFDTAIEGLDKFSSAASDADTSLQNLASASSTMQKWSWKASLGIKLSDEDISSYKESIDNYISSAKSYVEDKHYEFTAAVNVLIDPEQSKGMLDSANGYFAGIQEQLDAAGKDLKAQVDIALEDGVITADEQAIIAAAQQKMQEITDKIAAAETEANFKALQIKYSGADLDAESFANLQNELAAQVQEAVGQYDESLKVGIAGLQMQFNDGAINQEELDAGIKELTDGYNAKIDELEVRVEQFQFDALTDSYGEELDKALADSDFAGTTQEKIVQAMQSALKDGVDVATWDAETAGKYLGLDSLERESAQAITDITANIAKTIPEKLTEGLSGADGEGIAFDGSGFVEGVKTGVNNSVEEADFSETGSKIQTKLSEGLSSAGGEGTEFDAGPLISNVQTSVNNAAAEMDFTEVGTKVSDGVGSAITSAPMDKINAAITTLKGNVQKAIDDAFSSGFSTKTTVNITADYKLSNPTATLSFSGGGSGTATIKGSVTSNANGGISSGKKLSWINEEGPEAIIPLVPTRRARGLELWEKAGKALGVLNHANGGITGNTSRNLLSRLSNRNTEEYSTHTPKPAEPAKSGPIQVNVGGVKIEIKTDGNSGDIIQQIKAKGEEITNVLSEMISDAISEAYENIPLAGTD